MVAVALATNVDFSHWRLSSHVELPSMVSPPDVANVAVNVGEIFTNVVRSAVPVAMATVAKEGSV